MIPSLIHVEATTGLRYSLTPGLGDTALVLLHGMGGGLSNWEPVRDLLAGIAPTLSIELPWHGRSVPVTRGRTVSDVVSAVAQTLGRLWSGDVVLVGHSLGGYVALSLGQFDLGTVRIKEIVLVNGHLFTLSDLITGRRSRLRNPRLTMTFAKAYLTTAVRMPSLLQRLLNTSDLARRLLLPPFMNASLLTNSSRVGDSLSDQNGQGTRRIFDLARTVHLADIAARSSSPVTVIAGGLDPLIDKSDRQRAQDLLDVIDYVLIGDCAHWTILERSEIVAGILLQRSGFHDCSLGSGG